MRRAELLSWALLFMAAVFFGASVWCLFRPEAALGAQGIFFGLCAMSAVDLSNFVGGYPGD